MKEKAYSTAHYMNACAQKLQYSTKVRPSRFETKNNALKAKRKVYFVNACTHTKKTTKHETHSQNNKFVKQVASHISFLNKITLSQVSARTQK